ncbi:YaiI/YqxD family protein [Brevibacillus gelatini]
MQKGRVLIDADACPRQALAIAQELCKEYGWLCQTFASYNHQIGSEHHVTVDAGPQAVDMKLANETRPGDVVVTQDIGLAALILGKKAQPLTPHGFVIEPERIAFHLEERNEKARYRRGGGRTRGPAARTREDDQRFAAALRSLLERGETHEG